MPSQPEKRAEWDKVAAKVIEEVAEWRKTHPEAKFVEIEEAVDQRLAQLRNQMIADSSQSQAELEEEKGTQCESCGVKLHKRGKQKRQLLSGQGGRIELEREYLVCPKCGVGLFPPR